MKNNLSINRNFLSIAKNNITYFDYSATTFMPKNVMKAWLDYNENICVSIGRGNNKLSNNAEMELEKSEKIFKDFFGFDNQYEFIYTKNVTESINLISMAIKNNISTLDIILVGPFEHHSNYLPWKRLAKETGSLFFEIPLLQNGELDYEYIKKYKKRIKLISISSVSNVFGYKVDIDKICNIIDEGTFFFVDESQLTAHDKIVNNDRISGHFISSHKMYGPKNISLISIRKKVLSKISPIFLGGGMVNVSGYENEWKSGRLKFFAGTTDISLIVSFAESCNYIKNISYDIIKKMDNQYSKIIIKSLLDNGYSLIRNDNCIDYIISFTHSKIHAHDINEYLSKENIIIRSGNLCSQNSLKKLNINAINRISLGIMTTEKDVKKLCDNLRRIVNE